MCEEQEIIKLLNIVFIGLLYTCVGLASERNQILVYNDIGVAPLPLKQTLHMLKNLTKNTYKIKTINAYDLINKNWESKTALIVIPGGADIPYTKKLNGKGNEKIIRYVRNGGNYLGICAGGYYGANNIEFSKGTDLEVIEKRELDFYPGKVIGPVLAKYVYNSLEGARAAHIKWGEGNLPLVVYYNGGGYFAKPTKYSNVTVLARFEDHPNKPAAIVKCQVGKGTAILSGVHFEYSSTLLDKEDIYLKAIIPQLQKSNEQRLSVASKILGEFGIDTIKIKR